MGRISNNKKLDDKTDTKKLHPLEMLEQTCNNIDKEMSCKSNTLTFSSILNSTFIEKPNQRYHNNTNSTKSDKNATENKRESTRLTHKSSSNNDDTAQKKLPKTRFNQPSANTSDSQSSKANNSLRIESSFHEVRSKSPASSSSSVCSSESSTASSASFVSVKESTKKSTFADHSLTPKISVNRNHEHRVKPYSTTSPKQLNSKNQTPSTPAAYTNFESTTPINMLQFNQNHRNSPYAATPQSLTMSQSQNNALYQLNSLYKTAPSSNDNFRQSNMATDCMPEISKSIILSNNVNQAYETDGFADYLRYIATNELLADYQRYLQIRSLLCGDNKNSATSPPFSFVNTSSPVSYSHQMAPSFFPSPIQPVKGPSAINQNTNLPLPASSAYPHQFANFMPFAANQLPNINYLNTLISSETYNNTNNIPQISPSRFNEASSQQWSQFQHSLPMYTNLHVLNN